MILNIFHVLIGHLYIFENISIQILWLFLFGFSIVESEL